MAVLVVSGLVAACGGSSPDRAAEIDQLISDGAHDELLARTELYEEDGERSPHLDFGQGWGHLHQNADVLAAKEFSRAVRADSTLAPRVAKAYRAKALEDHENKWPDRAKRRMREAFRYDRDIELDPVADPVADVLFREEKQFHAAYDIYRKLVLADGPEKKKKEWKYRYGYCLERMGFLEAALAVYQEYRDTWPDDMHFMRYVTWRWMKNHIDMAEAAMEMSELDKAEQYIEAGLLPKWHMDLQQEGRFVAGQVQERKNDPAAALQWYELILEDGSRFGGEVVQRAKDRIESLNQQGVH